MMYGNYLEHHGIKGMKWGVRRFQREDGTRTSAGKKRYASDEGREKRRQILKRVAIGAGVAAAAAGTAYAVKRSKDNAVSDDEIRAFYRKANLADARRDGGPDWDTFNSKRGQYSRKQLDNIVRADRTNNAPKFHKAVNAKINPNKPAAAPQSARSPRRLNLDIDVNDETVKRAAAIGISVAAAIFKKHADKEVTS